MESTKKQVIAQACSKVLISGAYLILDPKYTGAVLATDALFKCQVTGLTEERQEKNSTSSIKVISQQFNKERQYFIRKVDSDNSFIQIETSNCDSFLDKCIAFVALLAKLHDNNSFKKLLHNNVSIELMGDNQFYSWRDYLGEKFALENLNQIPQFSKPLDPSKKTGLGSSAALIVSFLAATLTFFGIIDQEKISQKDIAEVKKLHIYAQILNAYVQEKVGSGFDIACSIYGSQIYRRFTNVEALANVIHALQNNISQSPLEIKNVEEIKQSIGEFCAGFDYEFTPFSLNKKLDLCLIDVNSGSDTKVMVKQVLDWAKQNQTDKNDLFSNILFQTLNSKFQEVLKAMQQERIDGSLIKQLCQEIRQTIQIISKETKVEIEPESSTRYLDQLLRDLEYVLYATVPGAGGNDALLIIGEANNLHENVQRDFCNTIKDHKLSVLPVKVLNTDVIAPLKIQVINLN